MSRTSSTLPLTIVCALIAALLIVLLATAAYFIPRPELLRGAVGLWLALPLLFILLLGVLLLHRQLLAGRTAAEPEEAAAAPPLPRAAAARPHTSLASNLIDEEHDELDALFDLLQDGTLVLDADDRILRANATAVRLLDPSAQDLLSRRLTDLADHHALEALVKSIRLSGIYQSSELNLQAADTLCNAAGIPLHGHDPAGAKHVMLVLRDISRLRQLERAGEEYATNVSHELKTPLTLILGYTETLLSHADMEPEFRDRSLRTIEHHAKRILRIIDDLLRLAWLKNEREPVGSVPRAPAVVADIVAEAVVVCGEWARNAGITIETHIPVGLVWSLHPGLMEEALVNLVKNAILYALVGPVEIRARVLDSNQLELAVIDRGPGLKPEDAKRIFDRFYRADKGRARPTTGGSGLGLPIVQQIVEAHHGTARVETALGAGCTFILEIPPN